MDLREIIAKLGVLEYSESELKIAGYVRHSQNKDIYCSRDMATFFLRKGSKFIEAKLNHALNVTEKNHHFTYQSG